MYRILDRQIAGRYFADGDKFETKEDVREQLISFHSIDCEEDSLNKMTLDEILDFGEWELEEAK